jgi:hypothetical protein
MYHISDQQIDFILNDISRRGIKIESLQCDLLDHICIIIEQNLEEGGDFEKFYEATIRTFYKKELKEIEEETLFLSTFSHHLVLSRNQFFLLLFIVLIGPFIGYDVNWLATSRHTGTWSLPGEIWVPTLIFALYPLLVLLVLFFTPEKFDPLIPRGSTILLGFNPLIKVLPSDSIPTPLPKWD